VVPNGQGGAAPAPSEEPPLSLMPQASAPDAEEPSSYDSEIGERSVVPAGCSVTGASSSGGAWSALALIFGLAAARRRRS